MFFCREGLTTYTLISVASMVARYRREVLSALTRIGRCVLRGQEHAHACVSQGCAGMAVMARSHHTSHGIWTVYSHSRVMCSFIKRDATSMMVMRYGTSGAPSGADIAQKILSCDDPSNLGPISLSGLKADGLSAVARAAATSEVTDEAFLNELVDKATRGLPQLSPADVCNIIESFSELGCYSIEFKDAVSDFVMANVESFSGDMLGHTLRSFAKMGYYDDDLLEGVLTYMAANKEKFSAENVADVVYAFSKCGFCHPDLVQLVNKAGELLQKEALHDKGEAIASIIDAYSRVGCTESDIVEDLILRVTQDPDIVSVDPLAKTLVAAIRLGSEDQAMINKVIGSLVKRIDDLNSELIVESIKALGGLGFRHDALLDIAVDKVLPQRHKDFSRDDLEDILTSLNKLGYYSKKLVSLLEQKGKIHVQNGSS